ncbi:ABC transporter ATP-binding protein [Aureivirga marina]|uniref:ABC transporter ATP-binding protein n=1 Tax=Aureivirga marina TaxID=1182451 RepID=UPI0018CA4396|nr:ABC transporter ATP-binding protein [Aureivirga marina]
MEIHCENISLTFQEKKIFEDLNFTIKSGENICIGGESGKGKSSLLKIIAGQLKPTSGQIVFDAIPLNKNSIKSIRNQLIWIPQNINLPVYNGKQLIDLMQIKKNTALVKNYLNDLGLDNTFLTKDFSKISGGQKQRIIISICLSLNKEIVLMDEPTSSLDEHAIELLIQLIKKIKNKIFISASHNETWLQSVDKIIQL